MIKRILVDGTYPEDTRIVVLKNKKILEFEYVAKTKKQIKGNIYLAKIVRVEPSLQAAFVDYGNEKNGFLPFSEIHSSYFHIPVEDRQDEEEETISTDEISNNFQAIVPPDLSDIAEDHTIDENSGNPSDVVLGSDENDDDLEPFEEHDDNAKSVHQKYKIQEVIKKNMVILVQAIKEERGNKGASFTSFISLAGRYCVLMPNSDKQGGISRRIVDDQERTKLKTTIEELNIPDYVSVIIRTAGQGRKKAEVKRDYDYLVRLWNSIREHTISSKAPTFIHAESDINKKVIRDLLDEDTKEVIVQGSESFKIVHEFTKKIFPSGAKLIKKYKDKKPIFSKYNVEEQISALYGSIAYLESGGYLVFNTTEALTSVDVNSGKSIAERNIEETAFKTNLEAASEVARQIKLRDISGLIVIDFIDMMEYPHRRQIERKLRDEVKYDKARIQIGGISNFGLLEMSRQRLRPSFIDTHTVICRHCNGKARVRSPEANSLTVFRTLEDEISRHNYAETRVFANTDNVIFILNEKRDVINMLEKRYKTKIFFFHDNDVGSDNYSIEGIQKKDIEKDPSQQNIPTVDEENIELKDINAYADDEDDLVANKNTKSRKYSKVKSGVKKSISRKNNSSKNKRFDHSKSNQSDNIVSKQSWWSKIFG